MRSGNMNVMGISQYGRMSTRTRLPMSWPNAHQIERTVRRYWCEAGTNSIAIRWNTKVEQRRVMLT